MYKLKEVRESVGLSQEKLAEKSGVSRTTISLLESGKEGTTTTTGTLLKLASALNCTVGDIFALDAQHT